MKTNAEYHADRVYLSSSSLKLLLKSKQDFYKQFVLNEPTESRESTAFTEGTLLHSMVLEPEKVAAEYAFYEGLRKVGKAYEEFVSANEGRIIISVPQQQRCLKMLDAYRARKEAVQLIRGGEAELVMTGTINDVALKVRHDYINIDKAYIVDVKTTSMPSGVEFFKETVHTYLYELSAILYSKIAYKHSGALFDFYWIVISKFDFECHVYKMSPQTAAQGNELLGRALATFKKCSLANNWVDELPAIIYDGDYEIESI